jgi:hypothetical protein
MRSGSCPTPRPAAPPSALTPVFWLVPSHMATKPDGQWQVAILNDRARCPRGLVPTGRAQPTPASHWPRPPGLTTRADEPLRPTE